MLLSLHPRRSCLIWSDLLDIAAHYELTNVNKSMLKQEIKNILVQFLVDQEMLDSSALSLVIVTQTGLQMREVPGSYPGRAPSFCYEPGVTRKK